MHRHFRGLAFAMMAVRQEGQDLADFTQQLTARRKALHRYAKAIWLARRGSGQLVGSLIGYV